MSTNQFKYGKWHTYLCKSHLGVTISLQIDIPILMRLAEASIHRVPPSSCYPLHRKLLNGRWTTTQLNNELVSSPKKNHQQISASDRVDRQSGRCLMFTLVLSTWSTPTSEIRQVTKYKLHTRSLWPMDWNKKLLKRWILVALPFVHRYEVV